MIVLQQLLWYLKPRTVIELGTYNGISALWMNDILKLVDSPCRIYSVDIDTSLLLREVRPLTGDTVKYIQGDVQQIEKYI